MGLSVAIRQLTGLGVDLGPKAARSDLLLQLIVLDRIETFLLALLPPSLEPHKAPYMQMHSNGGEATHGEQINTNTHEGATNCWNIPCDLPFLRQGSSSSETHLHLHLRPRTPRPAHPKNNRHQRMPYALVVSQSCDTHVLSTKQTHRTINTKGEWRHQTTVRTSSSES
jgi:hypothetical protein